MYDGKSVFRRIVLYILFITSAVIGSWVYLTRNYESDIAHAILEPIQVSHGYREFEFLNKTEPVFKDAAPIFTRSINVKGGADYLVFRLPKKKILEYIEDQKRASNYVVEKGSELYSNKLCKLSYDKVRHAFRVPTYFQPNLKSSSVKYGYVESGSGRSRSYNWCKSLDIFDFENENFWYIRRTRG